MKKYDVIVIGAGHAGCEAAYVCSKYGLKTALFTLNIDNIAQMSCNPSIGGLAKGHLVKEIDALGGIMGRIIDKTGIQFKMLNTSNGEAVWSPRAQADKLAYKQMMRNILENCENLDIYQNIVEELIAENGVIRGIKVDVGLEYYAKYVVLATGTFMKGLIHIGEFNLKAGRMGDISAEKISDSLRKLGFKIGRFKTGTPPRVNLKTIDYSKMEEHRGDENPVPFSIYTEKITQQQVLCYLSRTNERTKEIIEKAIPRSPLFSGKIQGRGPRYCPSIEDKIVRFGHKESHQVFLEPESLSNNEGYVNGVSTSLPAEVQIEFLRTIPGYENVQITRFGYAIEYDFVEQGFIKATLESKIIKNLYLVGQINGTSGYEEAAAQGIVAAYNIIHAEEKMEPFVLGRSEAYIGVLIDDIITKGIDEPYRMFTSRAEYRLLLRQDNAIYRLMEYSNRLNLIDKEIYKKYKDNLEKIKYYINKSNEITIKKSDLPKDIEIEGGIEGAITINKYLKRAGADIKHIEDIFGIKDENDEVKKEVAIEIKYEGYISRHLEQIKREKNYDHIYFPEDFPFAELTGISNEAKEKLIKIRPENIGQASRIPGVSPADISVLLIYLKKLKEQ